MKNENVFYKILFDWKDKQITIHSLKKNPCGKSAAFFFLCSKDVIWKYLTKPEDAGEVPSMF
jgi:hypothetical protein